MTTEYLSTELCGTSITTLPVINLQEELNDQRIPLQNENLKESVPVLQLHTLPVTLQPELNIQNEDKRLPGVYLTLPVATNAKYSASYFCRLCAAVVDISSAVSIFPSDEFQDNLSTKINKYLPIVVYETDPFPKTICKNCVTNLNQFHELFEKCALVEDQLRQTFAFDERYLEELTKKINEKSTLELHKPENTEQLYTISDFQFIENLGVNNLNTNSSKLEENKRINSEQDLELNKSEDLCAIPGEEIKEVLPQKEVKEVLPEKEIEVLSCKLCGESIKDPNDCLDHSSKHMVPNSNQYPCSYCGVIIKFKLEWENHIKSHFGEKSRKARHKEKMKIRQLSILKRKLKIFNQVHCCKNCKESLNNADIAFEHCLKHKPEDIKTYPCVLCLRKIGEAKLKDHVAFHYPLITKPVLSCDNCNNLYPDEKSLKYHRCTKLRKFKCSQCNLGFKSEDRLKFHEDFHKTKSTFCDICKKDFKFESRFYLHFSRVHSGIKEKPFCCDVCGKTFTWLTVLNSHKMTHTNERPYKCSKCDAKFCNKYYLNSHMPSHEDHPQFHCDKCEYYSTRKQNLIKHISRFHKEINSSQKCIRCQICNEIFPNKHHVEVEQHLIKHSQEEAQSIDSESTEELVVTKLYQCERCERCYASSEHLTQHRTKHDVNTPHAFYQCRLCNDGFLKHDLLVKHRKVHVNVTSQYNSQLSVLIVISCDICDIECVDYRQLLNHKNRGNCKMKKMSGTIQPKKVLIKKHLKPLKTCQLFVNSNGLFECLTCQRTYKNRRRYRLHLATHTNVSL